MSERRNDPQMRVVSADGIEEFKVQTGAYSAEYGRTSNGILNYTTKSGTNSFHGALMAAIRNEDLNAGGFFYGAHSNTIHRQNLRGRQRRRSDLDSQGVQRQKQSLLLFRRRTLARQRRQLLEFDHPADRGFPQGRFPPIYQRQRRGAAL